MHSSWTTISHFAFFLILLFVTRTQARDGLRSTSSGSDGLLVQNSNSEVVDDAQQRAIPREQEIEQSATATAKRALTKALEYLYQEQVKEDRWRPLDHQWQGNWPQYFRPIPLSSYTENEVPDISPFAVSFMHSALVSILEENHEALQLDEGMYETAREMRVQAAKFMKRFQSVPSNTQNNEKEVVGSVGQFGFWPKDPNKGWPPKSELLQRLFDEYMDASRVEFYGDRVPFNAKWFWPHFMAVPTDADDTAVVISALLDHEELDGGKSVMNMGADGILDDEIDFARFFADARDTGEWQEYAQDQTWRPKASGAFVTWFSPSIVQNVDLVVNANILYLLGRSGKQDTPGFDNAIDLINLAAEEGLHRTVDPPGTRGASAPTFINMSYYYPNSYVLQYAVSRAFSKGATGLKPAMDVFVDDLINDVIRDEGTNNMAHWDLGHDAPILNTAFAIIALVNFAETEASLSSGLGPRSWQYHDSRLIIDDLIQQGAAWLVNQQTEQGDWDEAGVFFYANTWPTLGAEWISRPMTAAMALEAIARSLIHDNADLA